MQKFFSTAFITTIFLGFVSCAHEIHTHGFDDIEAAKENIVVAKDTRESVQEKLGLPTTTDPSRSKTWYYVQVVEEGKGIMRPKVKDHKMLAINFNNQGIVNKVAVEEIAEQKFAFVKEKTATGGSKKGFFGDIFGHIGEKPQI